MNFKNTSNIALVLANLIPLIGVIFYGWDAVLVLALFWIENLIIGAFNVVKMATVVAYQRNWGKATLPFFFIIHFGLFWTIHGIILWDILGFDSVGPNIVFGKNVPGVLELPAEGCSNNGKLYQSVFANNLARLVRISHESSDFLCGTLFATG